MFSLSEGQTFRWSYRTSSFRYPLWTFFSSETARHVTGFNTYLSAREALAHVLSLTAAKAWPFMALLYARHCLGDTLITRDIVSTETDLVQVQLGLYNHARAIVQRGTQYKKDADFGMSKRLFLCSWELRANPRTSREKNPDRCSCSASLFL